MEHNEKLLAADEAAAESRGEERPAEAAQRASAAKVRASRCCSSQSQMSFQGSYSRMCFVILCVSDVGERMPTATCSREHLCMTPLSVTRCHMCALHHSCSGTPVRSLNVGLVGQDAEESELASAVGKVKVDDDDKSSQA